MAILEAHGLVKWYGRRKVVDGVSFQVDAGEVVGLLGPNGAGKTTSFKMTTGQITPNEGKIVLNGHDVTQLQMYKRARLGMGYLSQEQSVFRKLTVEQNVLAILEAMPFYRSLKRRLTRPERNKLTDEVLERFGIARLRKSIAGRLSGGERRRLEIARCLVCDPLLILMDEPFTGIDPPTITDIKEIVRDLRNQGIGILVTDHQVREILTITDRSYLIKDGQVRTQGTPQQLIHDPIAISDYFGTSFRDDIATQLGAAKAASAPAAAPPAAEPPAAAIHQIVEQEKVRKLVEILRSGGEHSAAAAYELEQRGPLAIPALLEALERRDPEMRQVACEVLGRILQGAVAFDPYGTEAQRRQQLALLRERLGRKAG